MTMEQKALLRQQINRRNEAQRIYEREHGTLNALLVMLDARFADPESGVSLDVATLEVREPDATA